MSQNNDATILAGQKMLTRSRLQILSAHQYYRPCYVAIYQRVALDSLACVTRSKRGQLRRFQSVPNLLQLDPPTTPQPLPPLFDIAKIRSILKKPNDKPGSLLSRRKSMPSSVTFDNQTSTKYFDDIPDGNCYDAVENALDGKNLGNTTAILSSDDIFIDSGVDVVDATVGHGKSGEGMAQSSDSPLLTKTTNHVRKLPDLMPIRQTNPIASFGGNSNFSKLLPSTNWSTISMRSSLIGSTSRKLPDLLPIPQIKRKKVDVLDMVTLKPADKIQISLEKLKQLPNVQQIHASEDPEPTTLKHNLSSSSRNFGRLHYDSDSDSD